MTWRRGTRPFCHKIEYRVTALLLAALLLAVLPPISIAATSEDIFGTVDPADIIHNEEPVDPDEEDPDEEDEKGESGFNTQLSVSENVTYNEERALFTETFGSASYTSCTVSSNVANGMYTNDPVTITLGSQINGVLYRNGQADSQPLSNITEAGNYVLRLSDVNANDLGSFTFRITDKYTNTAVYKLPDGFSVYEVLKGGKEVATGYDQVSMADEGEYLIVILCDKLNKQYTYEAIVDHTAPTLLLSELNENNTAKTSVDISDLERGVTLVITRDGETITNREKLVTPGQYQLVLTDPAGNMTVYSFVIYMYLTVSGTMVIIILGGLYIALMIYLILSRKKMRVR